MQSILLPDVLQNDYFFQRRILGTHPKVLLCQRLNPRISYSDEKPALN